jgi:hypothetical protein
VTESNYYLLSLVEEVIVANNAIVVILRIDELVCRMCQRLKYNVTGTLARLAQLAFTLFVDSK